MRVRTKYFHLAFRTLYLQMLQRKVLENSLSWGREKKSFLFHFTAAQWVWRARTTGVWSSSSVRRDAEMPSAGAISAKLLGEMCSLCRELRSWRTWSSDPGGPGVSLNQDPVLDWQLVRCCGDQRCSTSFTRQMMRWLLGNKRTPPTHTREEPATHCSLPPPPQCFS